MYNHGEDGEQDGGDVDSNGRPRESGIIDACISQCDRHYAHCHRPQDCDDEHGEFVRGICSLAALGKECEQYGRECPTYPCQAPHGVEKSMCKKFAL